jgi:hypothetical protein
MDLGAGVNFEIASGQVAQDGQIKRAGILQMQVALH